MFSFKAKVEKFETSGVWSHFFSVKENIAKSFIEGKNRRVLCSINGSEFFQCALMHGEDDLYFINLNKEIRKMHQLELAKLFEVVLKKDLSEFGLPFPIELREVLDSDLDANNYFDSLTPGKKRNLLYIVNKPKSIDKRIEKSLVIAKHLNDQKGKIDFKQLNEDFKNYNS